MSLEIVSLIMTTVVVFEYLIGRGYKQVVFFLGTTFLMPSI
jgi:hypothetical protein